MKADFQNQYYLTFINYDSVGYTNDHRITTFLMEERLSVGEIFCFKSLVKI